MGIQPTSWNLVVEARRGRHLRPFAPETGLKTYPSSSSRAEATSERVLDAMKSRGRSVESSDWVAVNEIQSESDKKAYQVRG